MDIRTKDFYYFSVDIPRQGLPTECVFIKELKNEANKEVALIKCKNDVEGFNDGYLAITPRNPGASIFSNVGSNTVFLYVFDGLNYLDKEFINLSLEKGHALDIGGITANKSELEKWCK